ncbi:MAG: redoxin domain-containing protein [Fidelibacterota bacterium]
MRPYRMVLWVTLGMGLLVAGLPAFENDRLDFEIVYTATIENIPESAKRVRVWIPYPQSDRFQQVHSIRTRAPYPTYIFHEPEFGNRFLYMEAENPGPNPGRMEIGMEILASRVKEVHRLDADSIGELGEAERAQFDRYFVRDLDAATRERVMKIVRDYVADQPSYLDKVKAIYDYVYDNMEYRKDIPGYGRGDVGRACRVKSGNCVDFHSLFVAIAQEAGIVATEVANIDLPFEEGSPNYCSANYHCNVEVYLPNHGWFPMDISHAKKGKGSKAFYFGSLDNLRLKLGRGRHIQLSPSQEGRRPDRLLHKPYVEIDGKVHEDVEVSVLATTYEGGTKLARRSHLIGAGEKVEPFEWVDIDGQTIRLAEFLGKRPIVINFFSTWCGRCIWETEGLNQASLDFGEFQFIRINLMEPVDKVTEFSKSHGIPFPVLADEKGELARLFGIKYVPTNIIIDREGVVRFSGGLLQEGDLRRRLMDVREGPT